MEAKELRIGNFIQIGITRELCKVVGVKDTFGKMVSDVWYKPQMRMLTTDGTAGPGDVLSTFTSQMVGEPLTPEWLERFGFSQNGIPTGYTIGDWIQVRHCLMDIIKGTWQWNLEIYKDDNWITASRPQYVHQLQNIAFSLTGEELTLKEVVK